ncbi:MAG: PfkB family carbohydrate kinase, partial [Pseudomonadota bacterium]
MNTERRGILCAGNWIVDLVHDITNWPDESNLVRIDNQSRGIGGGAANVIAALARLETGLPLWPMGAIGDDEPGQFILERCVDLG